MSYQVLARKWRPRSFQELAGQEHVVRALVNALDHGRLHHALLFTGTRGVGKTTIARIFAKSLNCEQGITSCPCGTCGACAEIDEGRFVDLIEVDAASRTKVEDTRELLENVQYAPTRGRYKVYLIDEVHMLSSHSFNALLKTLEEPPPHVKFLLATTDPQRLPVTILSRCLQFNLKRLSVRLIANHLERILQQEGIEHEVAALSLVARAGEGSMRDALSLLEQAIAFGNGRVGLADAKDLLGTIDHQHVLRLLQALAEGKADAVLNCIAEFEETALDYAELLAALTSLLQRVAVVQAIPGGGLDDDPEAEALRQLAAQLAPEDVQLFYQIALIGRRDLHLSPEPRGGLEMVLLRMLCFRPVPEAEGMLDDLRGEKSAQLDSRSTGSQPPPRAVSRSDTGATTPVSYSHKRKETAKSAVIAEHGAPKPGEASLQPITDWNTVVASLGLNGIAKQLALHCVPRGREGNRLHLRLDPDHAHSRTKNGEQRLQAALQDYLGEAVQICVEVGEMATATPARQRSELEAERQKAAEERINTDPNVQALCQVFNARIKPGSITPSK